MAGGHHQTLHAAGRALRSRDQLLLHLPGSPSIRHWLLLEEDQQIHAQVSKGVTAGRRPCRCLTLSLTAVSRSFSGTVCNVLLTCCKDSVCRLWAETLLPSDCLLSGLRHNYSSNDMKANNMKKSSSNMRAQNQNPMEVRRRNGASCATCSL